MTDTPMSADSPVTPSVTPVGQVDPSRRLTDLYHHSGSSEILECDAQLLDWRSEALQCGPHTLGIRRFGADPNIHVARRARHSVDGHRVRAHDKKAHLAIE